MFEIFNEFTAPEESRQHLIQTRKLFKMIPNLEGTMAVAPALLKAYSTCWDLFSTTSLSPIEQQVVYQTANFENECNYCVPWHTLLSKQAGMKHQDIEALRNGARLSSERLNALHEFAQCLIRNRGKVLQADMDAFLGAGYSPEQALEVVLGVAIKTMSNYTNSISGTPLDTVVQKFSWRKPVIAPHD